LFLDEDEIIPEAFLLGDQPVAVASLRRGEAADTLDLGWVRVAARYWHVQEEFLVALVGRCLASAAGRYETLPLKSTRRMLSCGTSWANCCSGGRQIG